MPTLPNLPTCTAPKLEFGIWFDIESADVLAAVCSDYFSSVDAVAWPAEKATCPSTPNARVRLPSHPTRRYVHTQRETAELLGIKVVEAAAASRAPILPQPPSVAARASHVGALA